MPIDLNGYENVNPLLPGEFAKLPAGGYVCRVINSTLSKSKAGNPMLVLFIDIAEGSFKGFFKDAFDRVKAINRDSKWDNSATYRQLIFDKDNNVSSFFKGLITCFERSNPNFKFNPRAFDEQLLRGLLIGFIFAEEEYQKRDGSITSRVFIKFPRSIEDIRNANFSIPDIKKITPSTLPTQGGIFAGTTLDDSDVPF